MRKFTFLPPELAFRSAFLLREHAGRIKPIAGGTDLMVELRGGDEKLDSMDYALDLTALSELRAITLENGIVSIGAMATHDNVAHSPVIRSAAAMLAEASASVGAQQIRNAATIGGNVCNAAVAADTLSPLAALDARVTLLSVFRRARTAALRVHPQRGQDRASAGRTAHEDFVCAAFGLPEPVCQARAQKSARHLAHERFRRPPV
jgi:CO/xanthine dehydrogenase FAD-binding subunit